MKTQAEIKRGSLLKFRIITIIEAMYCSGKVTYVQFLFSELSHFFSMNPKTIEDILELGRKVLYLA
jgi:hypothetical protein